MNYYQREPSDFTVQVSAKEKILTTLLFALFMGGILFFARQQALLHKVPTPLFNLSFAIGLFGILRMLRAVFAQDRRGVHLFEKTLQIDTLFSQVKIPLEDLVGHTVVFKESHNSEPDQISFLWGQFRYRLPCYQAAKLKDLLAAEGVRVLMATEQDQLLKMVLEKAEHLKSNPRRSQRPPATVLLALILWSLGTVGMFFFH